LGLDSIPRYRVYPAGMRSSEVASRAGVNVQTIRYYERRGILPEPARTGSGYRSYDDHAVRTVRFVKGAQQLGFSLEEIDSLLELAVGGPSNCDAARKLATEKVAELEAKIARLSAMADSLRQLAATCDRSRNKRDCPLLEAIEDDTDIKKGAVP
jgi:Hg(II)-responsive transcriptional regulator